MATTGHGADLTFGTQSFDPEYYSITPPEESVEAVNISTHVTTGHEDYCAGDLIEGGEIQVTGEFDADDDPTIGAANETITLTFPVPAGLSNGATYSFTGFIMSFQGSELVKNQRMEFSMTVKIAGDITKANAS